MAIPGKWDLYFDWECDGTYIAELVNFNDDGTWTGKDAIGGRWWEFLGKLIFKYDDPKAAIYFGTITGDVVSGFMTEGSSDVNGCWYMVRRTPRPPKEGAQSRDMAGKPTAG